MSKTLPNFLDTAYGEKILPMRTLSQLSPSRSSGLLGTWLGEKLSPSLSVSPPLIWPTWWSQVEISHFYISQTILAFCHKLWMIEVTVMYKKHMLQKKNYESWMRFGFVLSSSLQVCQRFLSLATEHQQSIANKITNQMLLVKNATLDVFPQKQWHCIVLEI